MNHSLFKKASLIVTLTCLSIGAISFFNNTKNINGVFGEDEYEDLYETFRDLPFRQSLAISYT